MTRTAALVFAAIILAVILLPSAVVSLGRPFPRPGDETIGRDEKPPEDEQVESLLISLFRADTREVVTIDLEEYLVGVVLAEMPASFGPEALKAQAVIARTYTLHRVRFFGGGGCQRSPTPADICSDSTHCQAWVVPAVTAAQWYSPDEMDLYLAKVRRAVRETAGEVAVYQGRLIEAVYHSTCGGRTEASHAIWSGGEIPYLQSIACPYCGHSPYFRRETLVGFEQLTSALQLEPVLPVAGNASLPLQVAEETPGGRVGVLKVDRVLITGKDLRRLLGLLSTAFQWEVRENGLLFLTRGHGHGVGLCQYGADGMAAQGKTYRQIVSFYYPGTTLSTFTP
jgi:stage II sporulation protein D